MDTQATIYALDKYNNGNLVWKYDYPDDYIYGEMVLENGFIYFGDSNSQLVSIAQTGEPHIIYNLSKYQATSPYEFSDTVSTPAIDGNTAYLGWANQVNAIQLETP